MLFDTSIDYAAKAYAAAESGDFLEMINALNARAEKINIIGTDYGYSPDDVVETALTKYVTAMGDIADAASFMPVATQKLREALGMHNAGVTAPETSSSTASTNSADLVGDVTQRVLEKVLPAMASGTDTAAKQPLYVGTLVADDRGLRALKKQLDLITAAEGR